MASSRVNIDFAKRFVARQVVREVLRYLERNPEEHLPRLTNAALRLAPDAIHQRHIRKVMEAYRDNPSIHAYINRFFHLHPNVKRRLLYNWFVNAQFMGVLRQAHLSQAINVHIPNFILVDPTSACNLRCEGCWAGGYAHHDTLEFELVDRLCREAKELGIYWIAMSGGEPFLWPQLIPLAERHNDMAFMLYTNGTLINAAMADQLQRVGNITPAISLEGWKRSTDARRGTGVFDRIMAAMDRLRERGLAFGISLTITRENVDEVTSDDFITMLLEKGALYGWSFHYIPIGREPNPALMVTPEQRAYLAERIPYIRTHLGLQIADFWNDGELTYGCIAGGRRYFHITASGAVEPCAFVHLTTDNIREKSVLEVLKSPLFSAFQRRQPFCENFLRTCPIIDVPETLRAIAVESGAKPSHPGADDVLSGTTAQCLDLRAAEWKTVADAIWDERHPAARAEAEVGATR